MVTLSAMTVEDEGYEVEMDEATTSEVEAGGDVGGDDWQTVCGVKAKPIKILLCKDMSEITKVEAYQDGASVDAWLDEDCTAFVLIDDGKDLCYLEAEEFEILDGPEVADCSDDKCTCDLHACDPTSIKVEFSVSWEADALEQIKRARLHVARMEGRYLEAKERAKDCKQDWEAAVNHLTEVIDDATKPMPLFDQPATKEQLATIPNSEQLDPTDDAWRNAPIDDIFSGLTGFGPKKQEALRDLAPTLGAFEDLRKKASLEGNPLKDYMPKGIGQDACDQLEEAALNAISRILTLGDDDAADDDDGGGDDDDTE